MFAVNANNIIVIDVVYIVFLSIFAITFRIDVQCNENEHVLLYNATEYKPSNPC